MPFMKVICEHADKKLNICIHGPVCDHGKVHEHYRYCKEDGCDCIGHRTAKCVPYQPFIAEIERILEF